MKSRPKKRNLPDSREGISPHFGAVCYSREMDLLVMSDWKELG